MATCLGFGVGCCMLQGHCEGYGRRGKVGGVVEAVVEEDDGWVMAVGAVVCTLDVVGEGFVVAVGGRRLWRGRVAERWVVGGYGWLLTEGEAVVGLR
ncbi:hypothetical protein RIF29_38460 [Crotalaria pallida]|uniref:Uncharacterized protein n=1 Tax=Crotalaria pallida TaxID=3830 RepID=A0AAN9E2B3_CROPI